MDNYKYRAIAAWAKRYIEDNALAAGDRFYSETELCRIHNVSRQTVRQALAVLERQNVLTKRRGSGTFVQTTKQQRVRIMPTVGVIATYFSDYIFPSIVTGIESELAKNDVAMQLAATHNHVAEETRALQAMLAQEIDGLIVEPCKSGLPNPNTALYDEIRARGIPLIFFNAKYPQMDFPLIAMDDKEAGRIAAEHLISLGHEKVAALLVFDDYQGQLRYKGYLDALMAHHLPLSEGRILWFSTDEWDSLFTVSKERVLSLLSGATAVLCYNDKLAAALVDFCKKEGILVPDGLSVAGIDDSSLAERCEVPLTSVTHPKQKLGEKAAALLLEMIRGGTQNEKGYLYRPRLVIRRSTAEPAKCRTG
ncbi:MAG: GntR family transcriptional regulator [Gracilibacteraceae bacterium]|jgi:GntR family transcriptional regulator of arabinose operon|nr:GntR family transcriptional regulator [Gracilibacteraceae bacterium]